MPTTNYLSKLTLPVNVEGTVQNVECTLKDAEARQLIEDIGHAIYWIGVTTDALTDGATTNPITVNGESVTANLGGMASYSGSEFVWNGSAWQELGKNNFGALAFKSSASASYTPAGSVEITKGQDTTAAIVGVSANGTVPEAYFTVANENATFVFNEGAMPTLAASVDALTARGTDTAAFTGTAATITVE